MDWSNAGHRESTGRFVLIFAIVILNNQNTESVNFSSIMLSYTGIAYAFHINSITYFYFLCISNDIEGTIKSADDYADKAEKLHDLTYIAKSNSLRRAAKDKDAELKSVSDQLEAARLQLQDC